MKNTERFSDRVDNYIKYRPHYPDGIIPYLQQETGLTPQTIIADIGVGTGISSLPFLDNGNTVWGVEPNREMRQAAEKILARFPSFKAVSGSAEHTMLPDASVDMILAGQAFHWFNHESAKAEFIRITRKGAYAALIWNERLTGTGFEAAYEKLLLDFAIDYNEVDHRKIGPAQLNAFYGAGGYKEHTFNNAQIFDFAALKGRLLSSSYAPNTTHPLFEPMLVRLEDIFGKYNEQGMVKFHYTTRLFTGKLE